MTASLETIRGRILDVDAHEFLPISAYPEVFGERGRKWLEAGKPFFDFMNAALGPENPTNFTLDADEVDAITPESVWESKGSSAPSAGYLERRPRVLDMMGIHRQLVFPGFGSSAMVVAYGGKLGNIPEFSEDLRDLAWEAVEAHNEWAADLTNKYSERLRPVGILGSAKPGVTPESLTAETARLIKMGLRAFFMSSGMPPAGLSPADRTLDPFYATLAEANVPIVFHYGAGIGYGKATVWARVPGFRHIFEPGAETVSDPYTLSQAHIAEENFVTVLTLGGVFERHPTLRVGCIEVGASWVGPLAERLDVLTGGQGPAWVGADDLKLRPSEYLNRNLRVAAFPYEPVELWLRRHANIQDVYCFSTDFPHLEGGRWALDRFHKRVAPLGKDVVEKFFCKNAELLLPN